MSAEERHAIIAGLQKEYIEWYGPRETWKQKTINSYHRELGVMICAVHILHEAGLLPALEARKASQ